MGAFEDALAEAEAARAASGGPPPAPAPRAQKGPATAPSAAVGSALEAAARRRAPVQARMRLEQDAAAHSPVWDEVLRAVDPTGPAGAPAQRRQQERMQQVWDQATGGYAPLGGRNPTSPIIGRDERGDAPLRGAADALTLGTADEAAGLAGAALGRGDYRAIQQREEGRTARAAEQAPGTFAAGGVAGTLPWLAVPGAGATRAERALVAGTTAGGMGAASGAGRSRHTLDEPEAEGEYTGAQGIAYDALASGIPAAGLGAAGSAGTEAVLGRLAGSPQRWARGAEASQQAADRARLEASGFWGPRAQDAIDMHGGPGTVADDLRQHRVGQRQGQMLPDMQRATDDLQMLGRIGSHDIGRTVDAIDAAGMRVPTAPLRQRADAISGRLQREGLETTGAAADRVQRQVAGLPESHSFQDALSTRQSLDTLGRSGSATQTDPTLIAAAPQFRALAGTQRQSLRDVAAQAGRGPQWEGANRMSELGHLSDEAGGGFRRLSVGGGMGGATASGNLAAELVTNPTPMGVVAAVPRAMAGRAIAQETRMMQPGVRAVVGEASARGRRAIADRLFESARSGALQQLAAGSRSIQQLVQAATRGEAAFRTSLHVMAQRDPEVRQLMTDAEEQDDTTPQAIRAIGASGETQ